jgi:hypothetical protein
MLGERYLRLNPQLPGVMSLKDVERIPELIQIADLAPLDEAETWLKIHWS